MRDGFELLIDPPMTTRATKFMRALAESAPQGAIVSHAYGGRHRVLALYGPGAPRRMAVISQHLARGGRVAMWDMGYWNRESAMRLSIDDMHPTAEQLARAPAGPGRREFALREDADPAGPVLLVGLGAKSVVAYGLQPMEWERARLREIKARFPGRAICWRPKGDKAVPLAGTSLRHGQSIAEALQGCSLVVARHSNVAVDACVAGVPVECDDGAAAALYRGNPAPSREERAEFLRRLSWWEWGRKEAPQAWSWIREVTRCA